MEREAEAKDNLWRARLDAVLMHRIWGSLIFLGIVYIIFFLSFAIGDPLVRLIQTGTQLFSVWACRMLEPWPRLQSLLGAWAAYWPFCPTWFSSSGPLPFWKTADT